MPISYQVELPHELLRTKGTGLVTSGEVAHHLRQLETDAQFRRPLDVILDLSTCTSLPNRDQLEGVANQLKSLGGRSRFRRLAVVVDRTALYGMIRMFEVLAEEQVLAMDIFHSVPEAELWLSEGKSRCDDESA